MTVFGPSAGKFPLFASLLLPCCRTFVAVALECPASVPGEAATGQARGGGDPPAMVRGFQPESPADRGRFVSQNLEDLDPQFRVLAAVFVDLETEIWSK